MTWVIKKYIGEETHNGNTTYLSRITKASGLYVKGFSMRGYDDNLKGAIRFPTKEEAEAVCQSFEWVEALNTEE